MRTRSFLVAATVLIAGSAAFADLPSGGHVFVLGVNGSLSARDPASLKTAAQGPETGALAPSGNRKRLFGMESAVGRVFEINPRTLAATPIVELKQPASDLCASPDGSRLLLTSLSKKTLHIIDTATRQAALVPVDGRAIKSCQFSADGNLAYLIPAEADDILIVDIKASKLFGKVALDGARPGPSKIGSLSLHPNPAKKLALLAHDSKIDYLDLATHKVVGAATTFAAPIQAVAFMPDGARYYALSYDKLFLVDLQSRQIQKTVELIAGARFASAAIDSQGKRLFISGNHESVGSDGAILNRDGKEFATIDLETGKKFYQAFPPVRSVQFIVTQ